MKAVVLQAGHLTVEDIAEPTPQAGQILVGTKTCGICGTDLHAQHHIGSFLEGLAKSGGPLPVDPDGKIVMGHEFCGEVLDRGRDAGRFKPGTLVVGLPYATGPEGAEYVGYSNRFPGGFAERMVLTERLLFEVPNGLPAREAALTEPFAIGAHAVERATISAEVVVMVVGCGPIGLAVIAALKARGIGPVVGMDYSSGRRRFAEAMGADEVVDPAAEAQSSVWARYGVNRKGRRPVVFECVGRPGVLQQIISEASRHTLVMGIGNSLEPCTIDQVMAFNKEVEIRFAMNYLPAEFEQTLKDIAEGRIDTRPMLTGVVPIEGVPQAFLDLKDAEKHSKIVVSFE